MYTYHLYIIPLFDIFITKVIPIIRSTETEHKTPRSNLKISYGTTLPDSADNGSIYLLHK